MLGLLHIKLVLDLPTCAGVLVCLQFYQFKVYGSKYFGARTVALKLIFCNFGCICSVIPVTVKRKQLFYHRWHFILRGYFVVTNHVCYAVIITTILVVTLWCVDSATALKCNGSELEALLAGHFAKGSVH